MVNEIRIYYEGSRLLQSGFERFISELRAQARERRCRLRLVSAQGTPCQDFDNGIAANPQAWCILLKDSEGPDTGSLSIALCERHGWSKSRADSIFWMVQTMESWFHADKDALQTFYGRDFKRNALKPNPKIEQIPKKDLEDGLSAATRDTSKGDYYDHKASHGRELLAIIKPDLVRAAAPNCQRLFTAVLARLT
jgi:hypothetical protein